MTHADMQCGVKCRSKQHAAELLVAVSRGNLRQCQLFLGECHNAGTICDRYGRTAAHIAASVGKWELLQWLLEEKGADIGVKDKESGWTVLHRSLFYGQLAAARILISLGANLQSRDREGLIALDIVMKDRLPHVEFIKSGLQEVFTWGDNSNFTLGHENEQHRRFPEAVKTFSQTSIDIEQVVMCRYHTVFLASSGQVYTCGFGRGGRLGHGNELTSLVPRLVEGLKGEVCVQIHASRDHTVMLMQSGAIYSCGLNDCRQLGQVPSQPACLAPRQINAKCLKGKAVLGVVAQRFHTVIYTRDAVFTWGLNAGQLGHQKSSERFVIQPRQVSGLIQKDLQVSLLSASNAATLVATTKGDVFAIHQYQCRKIVSRRLDIIQMCAIGGELDQSIDMEEVRERGGTELTVALLNSSGKVHIWRESDATLRRCAWLVKRQLHVTQICLCVASLAFITAEGEAFTASLPQKRRRDSGLPASGSKDQLIQAPMTDNFTVTLTDLVEREEINDIQVERVPMVHRATFIAADKKGRNFAVLQSHPRACLTEIPSTRSSEMCTHFETLLEETDINDVISDVIIQIGSHQFAAHKFILAHRSEYFRTLFEKNSSDTSPAFPDQKPVVHLDNIHVDIFRQLLTFIYTDVCQLLKPGVSFDLEEDKRPLKERCPENGSSSCDIMSAVPDGESGHVTMEKPGDQVSAFEICHENKKQGKRKSGGGGARDGGRSGGGAGQRKKSADKGRDTAVPLSRDPVHLLREAAKTFGIKPLRKKLESVQYGNGVVQAIPGKYCAPPALTFNRTKCAKLYDTCIRAEDGVLIQCHKCVLVARLEYFKSMFASGWVETGSADALGLPVPGDILEVVIDYLYTDDSRNVTDGKDVEFLCNVLVVADQLLIGRLKDMCQVPIASLLTLRNACEVLELASIYGADQLKVTCTQFIVINLAALLETRALDVLSDDVMDELGRSYRDLVPGMYRRVLTPYYGWPDVSYLEHLEAANPVLDVDNAVSPPVARDTEPGGRRQGKTKKKRTRTKSSGGEDGVERKGSDRLGRQVSLSCETGFVLELGERDGEGLGEEDSERLRPGQQDSTDAPGETRITFVGSPDTTLIQPLSPTSPRTTPWGWTPDQSPGLGVGVAAGRGESQDAATQAPLRCTPSGLRGIMAAEAHSAESAAAHHIATQVSAKKSAKLSQKERKKLMQEKPSDGGGEGVVQDIGTAEGARPKVMSPPAAPWASMTKVVQSFKDLVVSEEAVTESRSKHPSVVMATSPPASSQRSHVPHDNASGGELTISWGLSHRQERSAKAGPDPAGDADLTPEDNTPQGVDNPWQRPVVARAENQPTSTRSLTDIIRDEQRQSETLLRATNKPLALIQIEEKAIHELLAHYKADACVDETITVERVPATLASPTWAAVQRKK